MEMLDVTVRCRMKRRVLSGRSESAACGYRGGANRCFSRNSRSPRRIEVRTSRTRNRAQTLRWPSSWKEDFWLVRRISARRSSSLKRVLEPRRAGGRRQRGRLRRS